MGAYGGRDRAYVNMTLIAVNVLIFLCFEVIGDTEDTMFMIMHGAVYEPLVVLRGEYYLCGDDGGRTSSEQEPG